MFLKLAQAIAEAVKQPQDNGMLNLEIIKLSCLELFKKWLRIACLVI
jgi:hypothetical protein